MNIIVIGLGSMGKRRIRLSQQLDPSIGIVGVDLNEERRRDCAEKFQIQTAASIDLALHVQPMSSCALICTSPMSHADITHDCLSRGLHVFSELNLVSDRYEENINLADRNRLVLFMSSTFLYRDEMAYMREKIQPYLHNGGKLSYTYHIGQYLPDWHPWESYNNFFVGDKRTSGCREIMAIEFPWLKDFFGSVKTFFACADKVTGLDIDYPDNFHILLRHTTGVIGTLCVDVVSRKPVRNLEIYGENLYFSWDGSPTGLKEFDSAEKVLKDIDLYESVDHQEGYSSFVVENAYKNELQAFYEQVGSGASPSYNFRDDLDTLHLIDAIEQQAATS